MIESKPVRPSLLLETGNDFTLWKVKPPDLVNHLCQSENTKEKEIKQHQPPNEHAPSARFSSHQHTQESEAITNGFLVREEHNHQDSLTILTVKNANKPFGHNLVILVTDRLPGTHETRHASDLIILDTDDLTETREIPRSSNLVLLDTDRLAKIPELPRSSNLVLLDTDRLAKIPELPHSSNLVLLDTDRLAKIPELPHSSNLVILDTDRLAKIPELPHSSNLVILDTDRLAKIHELPHSSNLVLLDTDRLPKTHELPHSSNLVIRDTDRLAKTHELPHSSNLVIRDTDRLAKTHELPHSSKLVIRDTDRLAKTHELPHSSNLVIRDTDVLPELDTVTGIICSTVNKVRLKTSTNEKINALSGLLVIAMKRHANIITEMVPGDISEKLLQSHHLCRLFPVKSYHFVDQQCESFKSKLKCVLVRQCRLQNLLHLLHVVFRLCVMLDIVELLNESAITKRGRLLIRYFEASTISGPFEICLVFRFRQYFSKMHCVVQLLENLFVHLFQNTLFDTIDLPEILISHTYTANKVNCASLRLFWVKLLIPQRRDFFNYITSGVRMISLNLGLLKSEGYAKFDSLSHIVHARDVHDAVLFDTVNIATVLISKAKFPLDVTFQTDFAEPYVDDIGKIKVQGENLPSNMFSSKKRFLHNLPEHGFIVTDLESAYKVKEENAPNSSEASCPSTKYQFHFGNELDDLYSANNEHSSQFQNELSIFDKKEVCRLFRCTRRCEDEQLHEDIKESSSTRQKRLFEDVLRQPQARHVFQELVVAPFVSLRRYFDEFVQGRNFSLQDEMRHEGLRLKSFHKITCDASYIQLAAAGFYATGDGDETQCFSCGIRHRHWKVSDKPMQIHFRISPNCGFLTSPDTGNVPIDPTTPFSVTSADLMHGGSLEATNRLQDRSPSPGIQGAASGGIGVITCDSSDATNSASTRNTEATNSINNLLFSNAVYPHYSKLDVRVLSFSTWPPQHCKKPADLIPVGFYYAGYSDCVRCFVCGVGLRTWEAEDDPWVEHVRWRSSCDYIRLVKGEDFIVNTLAGIGRSSQLIRSQANAIVQHHSSVQRNGILSRDVCKQALEMGFSADLVRQHAERIIQNQGTMALKLDILVEKILTDSERETSNGRNEQWREPVISRTSHERHQNFGQSDSTQKTGENSLIFSEQKVERNNGSRALEKTQPFTITVDSPAASGSWLPEEEAESSDIDELQARPVVPVGHDDDDEGYGGSDQMFGSSEEEVKSLSSTARTPEPAHQNVFNSMPAVYSGTDARSQTGRKAGTDTVSRHLLATISEENREMRESSLCKICLDDTANIVFLPCGHLVTCASCSPALERCPVCRSFIRGSVRVHLAVKPSRNPASTPE